MSVPLTNLEDDLLAEKLADRLRGLVGVWNHWARATVGKQWLRAVDRIGANIAEGSGRHTFADNIRFVDIARGSLCKSAIGSAARITENSSTRPPLPNAKPFLMNLPHASMLTSSSSATPASNLSRPSNNQ